MIGNAIADRHATHLTRRTVMIANSRQQDLRTLSIDEIDFVAGGIAVGGCFPDRLPRGEKGKVVSVPDDTFPPTCPAPDRL
jgi:hypothetical protein